MNTHHQAMIGSPQHNPSMAKSVLHKSNSHMGIKGKLEIEVDQVAFSLIVRDEELLVIVKRFSDAIMLMKKVVFPLLADKRRHSTFAGFLTRLNSTVYIQNRYLGIFGPKANPILNMLVLSMAKRSS